MSELEPVSAVLVGAGKWANEFWVPLLLKQRHLRVRAVADPDLDRASRLAKRLGGDVVPFGSLKEARDAIPELDVVLIVCGPEAHAELIVEAASYGLGTVSEKPAAITVKGALALRGLPADFQCVVTQNYRYEALIQTLRRILNSGDLGAVQSLSARFAADYRTYGSWDVGDAHEMANPMLVEGSIHHFDMMRYLLSSNARRIFAAEANPAGSSFKSGALVAAVIQFENGVLGTYEASLLAAGKENRWHHEYYRFDCEGGAVELDGWNVKVLKGDSVRFVETVGDPSARDGHSVILDQFMRWRAGGPAGETCLADNLKSVAMVLAAVRSVDTGGWCTVE